MKGSGSKAGGSHLEVTLQNSEVHSEVTLPMILGSRVQGNLKVEVTVEWSRSATSVPGGNWGAFYS